MKNYLTKFGVVIIQTDLIHGHDSSGIYNEKMKILFAVNEKESAVECYDNICSYSKTNLFGKHGNYLNIFYLKDGPTFVRYGDIAAEKWYKQEEEKKDPSLIPFPVVTRNWIEKRGDPQMNKEDGQKIK